MDAIPGRLEGKREWVCAVCPCGAGIASRTYTAEVEVEGFEGRHLNGVRVSYESYCQRFPDRSLDMRRKNMAEVERETQVVEKVKLPTTTVVEGEATEPNEVEPQDHGDDDKE